MRMGELFAAAPVAAVIFVATIAISWYALSKDRNLLFNWTLHPYSVAHEGAYYQLITNGFVHGSFMHLLINMYVFYSFAFYLEGWMLGHINFAIVYFGSLLISSAISVARRKDRPDFRSLGASGAISGLLFSFILYNPNLTLLLFFIIPMPAWFAAVIFVGGSYYAAKNNYLPGIDHEAHIWGAIAGAALTIVLDPAAVSIFFTKLLG